METSRRPNAIWIFGDQHRAFALSGAGDPNIQTPNIDQLALDGEGRWQGVGGCPLCSPFRGSLLTSQYPHRCVPGHDLPLPDGARTVAHAFGAAGYRTAYFGKWHVDGFKNRAKGTRPAHQHVAKERRGGFDSWIGYENNITAFDSWVHGHDETGEEIELFRLPTYETDALSDLFIRYLNDRAVEQRGNPEAPPFFAALSVSPPHSPYEAPEEWMARHDPKKIILRPNVPPVERVIRDARSSLAGYYAMVENLDWNVGRIVQALRDGGLYDDTYIFFFSDHGDMLGSHGHILKCVPWEESIRIPFIVSGKARPPERGPFAESRPLVNHVDIAPTTLGLCGIEAPVGTAGTDYSGWFIEGRPSPSPADSAYLQLVDPGWTTRLVVDRERPWRGVVTEDGWKYAVLEGQPWMMFNLNEDPYEFVNLAILGRFKAERRRLQDRLAEWIQATGDSFILPDIA